MAKITRGGSNTQGMAAHDVAVSGNPVLVGGVATAAGNLPTQISTAGDTARLLLDSYGRPIIAAGNSEGSIGSDGGTQTVGVFSFDGAAPWPLRVLDNYYNGTSSDRARNNTNVTLLASAARTATPTKVDQTNYNARGIHVVIDVTADPSTAIITPTIQGLDAVSGRYYTLLAGSAISAVGTTVLRVFPGATAAANTVANDIMPRTFAVDVVHTAAESMTYSVGYSLIL